MPDRESNWFGHGTYEVPDLAWVDGDQLRFEARQPQPARRLDAPVLPMFLRLATDSPDSIVLFAEWFGILGVCEHALPMRHRLVDARTARLGACAMTAAPSGHEPIDVWRSLSAEAGDALQQFGRADGEAARRDVARLIARWVTVGDVRPYIDPAKMFEAIGFSGAGMLGSVARELLMAAFTHQRMTTCSGCSVLFFPKRRPTPNRRSYCPDCGLRAARRDASREFRRLNLDQLRVRERDRKRAARAEGTGFREHLGADAIADD